MLSHIFAKGIMSEWLCCDMNQKSLAAESMVFNYNALSSSFKNDVFPQRVSSQVESHGTYFWRKAIPRIKTTSIAAAQAEDVNDRMM